MTPDFSIVTCTRNSIATLHDTLRSVQSQRGVSHEHIFVDGGSTDGTLELLRQQPGDMRILEGVGGGISRAMNAGIAAARGEFVTHLHSDDYYLGPDVLARVAARMRAEGCDLLFGRIMSDIDGELVPEPFVAPRFSPSVLLRRNFIPHPATALRRDAFSRFGGFREDYRLAMDYEFWLRIRHQCRFTQIDEPLAAFRVHAGSASTADRLAAFNEDFRARFRHSPLWLWPEFALRYCVRRLREVDA
jgi:glycosyltransferase involved in cell wall biosynthesis